MLSLLKYLKGYIPTAIIAPLSKYIEAVIELIIPFLVSAMIDDGINLDGKTNSQLFLLLGIDAGAGTNLNAIILLGVIMATMSVIGLGFSLVCQYLASRAAVGFGTNLRAAMYKHIQNLESAGMEQFGSGRMVNRFVTDVQQVTYGLAMMLRLMLRAPFLVAGATVMCIIIQPQLWFMFALVAGLCLITIIVIMLASVPRIIKSQNALDKLGNMTGETMKGMRQVRAFNNQHMSAESFSSASDRQKNASTGASVISTLLSPASYLIVNIAIVLVLYFGSYDISVGALTAGSLIAIINYLTQMLMALIALASFLVTLSKAISGAKRIKEIFALPEVKFESGAEITDSSTVIEMRDAAFSFGGTDTVSGISFKLKAGQVLGVVGVTGSGKTTLANLAARLYLPTRGEVRLMGNNSSQYSEEQINQIVTLAPQKAFLFSGDVRTNMRVAGDVTDSEIDAALKDADAYGFVYKKGGLDSEVNQKGSNFSGGEKQRLSLARALLRTAPLLIIDDAISALDYVTEAKVKKNILRRNPDKAIVLISSRVGTVRDADYIIALEGKGAAQIGTHSELMKASEFYRNLVATG